MGAWGQLGVGKYSYNAESPKQGSQRFDSQVRLCPSGYDKCCETVRLLYLYFLHCPESPVVVHAFGDNGASVYQFLQEEMRCLGLATALKAVVFHGGPSEYYTVIPVALRKGGKVTDDQSWAHAAIVATI